MTLQLQSRLTEPATHQPVDLDWLAAGWTRTSRDLGGFFSGQFYVPTSRATSTYIQSAFDTWLGRRVVETVYGHTAWEGFIIRMNLVRAGVEYVRSLEPKWFHNDVNVYYSQSGTVDTNQSTLNYLTNALQDTGQDFSEWETLSGDAVYSIEAVNTDGTVSWGYCGAASTTTNADDTIAVFQDSALSTAGWNDATPGTAESYSVILVSLENSRASTGATTDAASQDVFGKVQYVVSLAGASAASATALRDRHLSEFGWPRARAINHVPGAADKLVVTVAGIWATAFWQYRAHSKTGACSDVIAGLVADMQFASSDTTFIAENTLEVTAKAYPMPQRIGDLLKRKALEGDASGNAYKIGFYNDAQLVYEPQPTTIDYAIERGLLLNKAGAQVVPELLRPGFYVRVGSAFDWTPPTASGIHSTGVSYVEQVDYSRDNGELTLSLVGQPGSIIALTQR